MNTGDETADAILHLQEEAQRAAESRIHDAHASLEDDDDSDYELAGAYCGCLTCDVREVLDAAWPYLYRLAHMPGITPP